MAPRVRRAVYALSLAAVLTAPSFALATPAGDTLEIVHPNGPEAVRGIGAVRLGEKHAAVEAVLGPGRLVSSGTEEGFTRGERFKTASYHYRSGTITIEVIYGEGATEPGVADEVDSISTSSPSALLFGHRLRDGLKTFERILKPRLWRIFHCDGEVFTTLLPGGPGTGISWKHGRLHEVVIDGGGSWGQQCER